LIGVTARDRLGHAAPDICPLLVTATRRTEYRDELMTAIAEVFEDEVGERGSLVGAGSDTHRS
jgi:hypothetical protein